MGTESQGPSILTGLPLPKNPSHHGSPGKSTNNQHPGVMIMFALMSNGCSHPEAQTSTFPMISAQTPFIILEDGMHNALKLRWWYPLQAPGQGLLHVHGRVHVLLDGPTMLRKELQGEVLGDSR